MTEERKSLTGGPKLRWLPLEASPVVYNKWAEALGLDTTKLEFNDVFSLDDEMLAWVNKPVKAVILLFPSTKAVENKRDQEDETIAKGDSDLTNGIQNIVYFKQTIGNACGTYALLHALANAGDLPIKPGSLTELFQLCRHKTPLESAALLEAFEPLSAVHSEVASAGQSQVPEMAVEVEEHYLAFVEHNGHLIELDGARWSPVNRGAIQVGLLEDAVAHIRKIVELAQSIRFNVITLGAVST